MRDYFAEEVEQKKDYFAEEIISPKIDYFAEEVTLIPEQPIAEKPVSIWKETMKELPRAIYEVGKSQNEAIEAGATSAIKSTYDTISGLVEFGWDYLKKEGEFIPQNITQEEYDTSALFAVDRFISGLSQKAKQKFLQSGYVKEKEQIMKAHPVATKVGEMGSDIGLLVAVSAMTKGTGSSSLLLKLGTKYPKIALMIKSSVRSGKVWGIKSFIKELSRTKDLSKAFKVGGKSAGLGALLFGPSGALENPIGRTALLSLSAHALDKIPYLRAKHQRGEKLTAKDFATPSMQTLLLTALSIIQIPAHQRAIKAQKLGYAGKGFREIERKGYKLPKTTLTAAQQKEAITGTPLSKAYQFWAKAKGIPFTKNIQPRYAQEFTSWSNQQAKYPSANTALTTVKPEQNYRVTPVNKNIVTMTGKGIADEVSKGTVFEAVKPITPPTPTKSLTEPVRAVKGGVKPTKAPIVKDKVVIDAFGGLRLPVEITDIQGERISVKFLADNSLGKKGEIKKTSISQIRSTDIKDVDNFVNAIQKDLTEPTLTPAKVEKPAEVKRATVEEIEMRRKKYELKDISLDEKKKWVDILKRAEKKKSEALYVAKAIKKKARVLTNDEFASLHLRSVEVEDLVDTSQANIAKAVDAGNVAEQERYTTVMDGALSELEEITEALRFSNREAGRALNIVKMALKREGEEYKLAKVLQKAKIAKGEKLTNKETRKLSELSRKIESYKKLETSLTKEIETLQEKLSKQDATSNFKRTTRSISRKRTQTALKTERESLFKALNKLGYRANEVIGVTYESAKIVSKLAINYFESGVKDIDAIVEKIQTKIPDLSNKDVYDSIGGRIKRTKKLVINETKRQIADLKTQARLLGEIEDAYNGIVEQIKKRRLPSMKVARLQRKLKELKRKATQSVRDDEKLRKILIKIDAVQSQLKTGVRNIKKTRLIESKDIQNAKQELSEIRRLISATDKIADLEKQLETGNFKVPVKIQRVIKNERLIETQVKLSQLRREVREHIHRMKKRTKRELFVDIVTLPRTLMATADFSGVLRQGAWLTARHPLKTAKIFVESSKAFFSQNSADEIDNAIRKHEYQPIREKARLFLASLDNVKFSTREEDFLSNLGDRIPVWGHVIKASNRNMASHLNLLRVASFDHYLKLYPNATDEELTAWASYINVASGRGYLGAFNKVADELSVAFFSPRFSSSRIELPFEIFRHWKHKDVRKEIAKDIMAFVAITGTALLLAKLAGFKVGIDPEDSDFLKIKIGDTRIDLLGGLQQPMRVMLLAMLKVLDTAGLYKMKRKIDLHDAVARFVRYKFSPAVSMPMELMQGKDAIGQERTILQTFTNNTTPMVFNEIIDTYKSNIVLGSILAPFILLGVGVGTYEKKGKKKSFAP